MRTTGIVFIVLGGLSVLGACCAAMRGQTTSFGGLGFIVLGTFLVSRAINKRKEKEELQKWQQGDEGQPQDS